MSIDPMNESGIVHGSSSVHKSLVLSESRGLILRRKTVVLRKELTSRIPKNLLTKEQ